MAARDTEGAVSLSSSTGLSSELVMDPSDAGDVASRAIGRCTRPRRIVARCRPECGWNFARRDLRQLESIESGGKVNRLAAELRCERLPSIDLAHVDLT